VIEYNNSVIVFKGVILISQYSITHSGHPRDSLSTHVNWILFFIKEKDENNSTCPFCIVM
jgi:hypothetical protein